MYQQFHRFRGLRHQFADCRRIVREDGHPERVQVAHGSLERMPPGHQLVIHIPYAKMSVCSLAFPSGPNCSGDDIGDRPQDETLHRHPGRAPVGCHRDPEIHDLDRAVRQHHDVGGLYVAVHHSLGVRVRQPLGHLRHDSDFVHHRERSALLDDFCEGLPLQKLHHQVWCAVLFAAGVNGDYILVMQAGGGHHFLLETLQQVGIALGQHDLDGDRLAHVGIPGLVHAAKSSASQVRLDGILPDSRNHEACLF